ncbi:helix-turn-helix domain-containing protein [Macrococcus sp. DPC7161]|uniref:helix-turn-helix domain-containing protein n=1 Tax=Macrococcus sp. DPC7161 TaxID=2507060 RepID=UPI00100B54D5|nr:helix-turn-helix domain-containing protein [Macrococcus sp. DPC7161]RXK19161.1 XRE family transcriptional regulator [Macrococcus sp. DPC7161]
MQLLGDSIKKRRKEIGMTQKELAKGISTQSQISKIEKNETIPLASLLIDIAKKLNLSLDQLVMNDYQSPSFETIEYDIYKQLLVTKEYKKIENLISAIDLNLLKPADKIYIQWLHLIVKYNLYEADIIDDINHLMEQNKGYLSVEMRINIYNTLGIIYRQRGDYQNACDQFNEAISYQQNKMVDKCLLIKVQFNYATVLISKKEYAKLYEQSVESINLSYQCNDVSILPELIFHKFYALWKMTNNINAIRQNNREIDFAMFLAEKQLKMNVRDMFQDLINGTYHEKKYDNHGYEQ